MESLLISHHNPLPIIVYVGGMKENEECVLKHILILYAPREAHN